MLRHFTSLLALFALLDGMECYEGYGMGRVNCFQGCSDIVDNCPRTIR